MDFTWIDEESIDDEYFIIIYLFIFNKHYK